MENKQEEKEIRDAVKLDQIAAFVKEHYSVPVIRIKTDDSKTPGLADSKFGGYPYWEKGRPCECSADGEPMLLLAQINFEKAQLDHPLFPKTGLLQFFIGIDDLYGMDLSNQINQDNFRVVYHAQIDESVTEEDVIAAGIRTNTELDPKTEEFPFYKSYSLSFEPGLDSVGYCAEEEYSAAIKDALKKLFNEELEKSVFSYFTYDEYDYLSEKLCIWGHKMLGYPNFTQYDPRVTETEKEFDTLLLQIDSESQDIMWGDCGVANFFINQEDLKKLDFSKVLYNWDCY